MAQVCFWECVPFSLVSEPQTSLSYLNSSALILVELPVSLQNIFS